MFIYYDTNGTVLFTTEEKIVSDKLEYVEKDLSELENEKLKQSSNYNIKILENTLTFEDKPETIKAKAKEDILKDISSGKDSKQIITKLLDLI